MCWVLEVAQEAEVFQKLISCGLQRSETPAGDMGAKGSLLHRIRLKAPQRSPTSLPPHERLTDLAVVPREKPHTGAAAREQPRASPVIAT